MSILLTLVPIMAILAVIIAIVSFGDRTMANAQDPPSQPATPQPGNGTFQSINDSFSVIVPEGWVIEDVSSSDTTTLLTEIMEGYRTLAQLCPQDQALPDTGGTYKCEEAQDRIFINRYPNLAGEPEFASIANNNIITQEHFLEYQRQKLRELGNVDINILNNTEMTINVTSTDTNGTIAMVPAKLVEMMYSANSTQTRGYFLLSATNATSNLGLVSGYSIFYEGAAAMTPSANPPAPAKQVFQSFEFVKEGRGDAGEDTGVQANSSAAHATTTTTNITTIGTTTQQAAITMPQSAALQH
jgi:hypothetical protein